jgi:benzoyl-CoA reductase/2-hydroxyglutaryl-CoA dehydratase subunit BcrC/BadD/HgdB
MTGADALEILLTAYDDRARVGINRQKTGAGLVGYFLNSVPIELIIASGLEPIRLVGSPLRRTPYADIYLEEYFDGEIRSLFDSLLANDFDYIDLLVIPRSSEVYLQMYYYLREISRWEPAAKLPPIHLFDLLQTPRRTTALYVLGRMRDFAARLEAAGGRPIDDAALSDAIATTNRTRAALQAVSRMWQGAERRLTGIDALKVVGAAAVLSVEEGTLALERLAADPPPLLPSRPRIMLKGSPQSDARATELIENAGAAIVAHDHIAGDTTYAVMVEETGDPWEALTRHYQLEIPGPRAYPQSKQDDRFIALAEATLVDGLIFFHDEWDDTLGWEYPDQKKLLDARGIPSLFLKRQPYFDFPGPSVQGEVEAFVASLAASVKRRED